MANRFWGGLQNLVASGNVYNKYRDTYAPRNVRAVRTISGLASNLVPGPTGAIGGLVGGMVADRMNGAQAFDSQLQMDKGYSPIGLVLPQYTANGVTGQTYNYGPTMRGVSSVPGGQPSGGIAGMLQAGRPQGGYTNFTPTGGVQRQQFTPDASLDVQDVRPDSIGIDRGNMVINSGARGGYAPRGQMGGGMSGGTFNRGQADGISGDAAREHYDGMRMGSLFGFRQSGGDIRGNLYEK